MMKMLRVLSVRFVIDRLMKKLFMRDASQCLVLILKMMVAEIFCGFDGMSMENNRFRLSTNEND